MTLIPDFMKFHKVTVLYSTTPEERTAEQQPATSSAESNIEPLNFEG